MQTMNSMAAATRSDFLVHEPEDSMQQRLEMLGTLTCGIAHDLNNMLAIVEGYTTLVDRELPSHHAAHDWLDTISDAAHRGIEMVRQIMAFGRPSLDRSRGQLRCVVDSSLKLMRSTLPSRLELSTDFTQTVPDIDMNPGQVSQIIMNLCINASHAIGESAGRIGLTVKAVELDRAEASAIAPTLRPGLHVYLSISDTGCGMSEATLQRIFDPYFTTKAPGKGTGLGLSLVRDIVASHGGAIAVRSRIGEGTTFDIYLPSAANAADVNRIPEAACKQRGNVHRIMYVDDNEPMAELMKELLETKGYAVDAFIDPRQAMTAFNARPGAYDLTVTDMNMPAMSGIDLANKLRQVRRDVPVILLSGWIGPEEQAMAEDANLNGVLLKSPDVFQLTETLHHTCQSMGAVHGNNVRGCH